MYQLSLMSVVILSLLWTQVLCAMKFNLKRVPIGASWDNARDTCTNLKLLLMPDFGHNIVTTQILPLMEPGEVIWVNAKHVMVTYPKTQETAGLKIGYHSAAERITHYLCRTRLKKRKCLNSDCATPVTWWEARDECLLHGMTMYNISTPRQTKSAMPHLMKNTEFWVGNFSERIIPDMNSMPDNMGESCVCMTKNSSDFYGYFRSNCSNEFQFFCASGNVAYAPTLQHLERPFSIMEPDTIVYANETMLPPTVQDTVMRTSIHESPDQLSSEQTASNRSLILIICSSAGGIVGLMLVVVLVVLYIRRRRKTQHDYLQSLQRYNQRNRSASARGLLQTIQHPCDGTGAVTLEYEKAVVSKSSKLSDSGSSGASGCDLLSTGKTRGEVKGQGQKNLPMYDSMDVPAAHSVKPKVSYINKRAAEQVMACYESFDPDIQQFQDMTKTTSPGLSKSNQVVANPTQANPTPHKVGRSNSTRSVSPPPLPTKPKKLKRHTDLEVKLGCMFTQTTTKVTNDKKDVKPLLALDKSEIVDLNLPNVTVQSQANNIDDLDQYENNEDLKRGDNTVNTKEVKHLDELDQYENFTYVFTKLKPDDSMQLNITSSPTSTEGNRQAWPAAQENIGDKAEYLDNPDQYENFDGPNQAVNPQTNDLNDLDAYENSCFT